MTDFKKAMNQVHPSAKAFTGILFDAINRGDVHKVKQVLGAFTSNDLNEIHNDYGHTFLTQSCALGETQITRTLIDAGADVNIIDGEGDYPLGSAAWVGNVEIVQLLLDRGADPDLDLSQHPDGLPLDEWVKIDHPCYEQIQHKRKHLRSENIRQRLMDLPQTKGIKNSPARPAKM